MDFDTTERLRQEYDELLERINDLNEKIWRLRQERDECLDREEVIKRRLREDER